MARKTLGYVVLVWNCPSCGSRNPGPQKTCSSCGAPQPPDVKFEQFQSQQLIEDEEEIERAKTGPDIHCGFCGARNPAETKVCTQCGADLSAGAFRASGEVIGAFQSGEVEQRACPHCGALNPVTAANCAECGAGLGAAVAPPAAAAGKTAKMSNNRIGCMILAGLAVCVLGVVIVMSILGGRTEGVSGSVQAVEWSRSVVLEALAPVTLEDWRDELPFDATPVACRDRYSHTQDEPAAISTEVCGTPYTVDKGSGYGEVVQDCQYQVYREYCEYSVIDWVVVDEVVLKGSDLSPRWPEAQPRSDQRLGERQEKYTIVFNTDKGVFSYVTDDARLFEECEVGSRWQLNINTFNTVVSIEPLR